MNEYSSVMDVVRTKPRSDARGAIMRVVVHWINSSIQRRVYFGVQGALPVSMLAIEEALLDE